MSISLSIVSTFTRSLLGRLPACVRDLAISWHKNLSNTVDEGDTYDYVKDSIGTRTDDVYYGQYLDVTSGQINFYRTSGSFDYTDPSDGALVEGVTIPGTGLYTVPANGICDIGVTPRVLNNVTGVLDFDGDNDNVVLSAVPDVTGSKTISFYLFLPETPTWGSQPDYHVIINFHNTGSDTDHFYLYYADTATDGQVLGFQPTVAFGDAVFIDYATYSNQLLNVVVTKTAGLISSISIDGVVVSTTTSTSQVNNPSTNGYIGSSAAPGNYSEALVWDILVAGVYNSSGHPEGNTDSAWGDSIGIITTTVNGTPTITNVGDFSKSEYTYTSFYPIAERAGAVLHDIYENSYHISVDTPVWAESLYGSDYLNQQGFIDKVDSDALGYDWEANVNGIPVTLNDSTLIPLGQWELTDLLDSSLVTITDNTNTNIQVKINL